MKFLYTLDSDSEVARKDLNAELNMLKLLPKHPNVVAFLGCCTLSEPPLIIVEYCAHGDLQGLLRNSRGISESYYKSNFKQFEQMMTSKMLLNFALQVSTGMSYLAAFKVHCFLFWCWCYRFESRSRLKFSCYSLFR